MKRDLICKRCSLKMGEVEGRVVHPKVSDVLCEECHAKSVETKKQVMIDRNKDKEFAKKVSERMKEKNPMKDISTADKVSETLKRKYASGELTSVFSDPEKLKEIKSKGKITKAGRQRLSDRMKLSNPMCNKEYRDKMQKTFNDGVKSGRIVYKKGKEHHLWKGNRGFMDTLRVQLYPKWTKLCMERDGFKCVDCDSNRELTVHHLKPFRDFVAEVLQKYNLKNFSEIDSNEWQQYFDEIIENHSLDDGITLCKSCHQKRDKYFIPHRKKDENQSD